MLTIHRLSTGTVLAAELRNARYFLMGAYRNNTETRQHADTPYIPRRLDTLGLYRIAGAIENANGSPLDGLYAHDDFGQLVRVPLETALALLN